MTRMVRLRMAGGRGFRVKRGKGLRMNGSQRAGAPACDYIPDRGKV